MSPGIHTFELDFQASQTPEKQHWAFTRGWVFLGGPGRLERVVDRQRRTAAAATSPLTHRRLPAQGHFCRRQFRIVSGTLAKFCRIALYGKTDDSLAILSLSDGTAPTLYTRPAAISIELLETRRIPDLPDNLYMP